jgi:hypothetical protein
MKVILFITVCLLVSTFSYSQLDSVNVTTVFVPYNNPSDSTQTGDMLKVKVWVNDLDFLGQVIVDVIDTPSDYPLSRIKYTKAQIVAEGLVQNGWIVIETGLFDPAGQYTIRTSVKNYQLLDLPIVTTALNATSN